MGDVHYDAFYMRLQTVSLLSLWSVQGVNQYDYSGAQSRTVFIQRDKRSCCSVWVGLLCDATA